VCSFAVALVAADAPADQKPMPHRPTPAERARLLEAEASKLDQQLKALDKILAPFDKKSADCQKSSSNWDAKAAKLQADAAQLEQNKQAATDPIPQVRSAAGNLQSAGSSVRGLRETIAGLAAGQGQITDEVIRQAGVDLGKLGGSLDQSAQALSSAGADQLGTQIRQLESNVRGPLDQARRQIDGVRAAYEQRFRSLDPQVDGQNRDIGYWQGERAKHEANANAAYQRCLASKFVVAGVEFTKDPGAWTTFNLEMAGVWQADKAIDIDHTKIGVIEAQRLGDGIGWALASAAEQIIGTCTDGVDRQLSTLRDAEATFAALRKNFSLQELAAKKRERATEASAQAAKYRTMAADVYRPVNDKVKLRDQLKRQRDALLNDARRRTRGGGTQG
jgi:hypothetical protein